ncbi:hypothetical protein P8452_18439 [Trifolium repens]|nr:alpha/beta hydrolase family protein [Trifolium repens]WJX29837.1 hypothetical protein P8452_18439 [Trifolium repens]
MLLNNIGAAFCYINLPRPDPKHETRIISSRFYCRHDPPSSPAKVHWKKKNVKPQSICTADELHHITVPNSNWKLALWRYLPSPKAPLRNHPLLLLSGVATNAIGYDLSPEASFARYMSAQGFDTWTLEVRGAGLSTYADSVEEDEECLKKSSETDSANNDGKSSDFEIALGFKNHSASFESEVSQMKRRGSEAGELRPTTSFMEIVTRMSDSLASILGRDLLEERKDSAIVSQIKDFNRRLQTMTGGQNRFTTTLEELQKQIDLIVKYDWDFDHYLEEDIPAAMEYIKGQCQPSDGKLLAIGHSMGGILLYAKLSRRCFDGKDSEFASVVTLASSLDYTSSRTSLKWLLPLVEPIQALNVPAIPVGPLIASAYPLARYPPYVLSWLNSQISAQNMMDKKLYEKLVFNNFGTVPSKLLLQLKTVLQKGGLRNRSGAFVYKDHLSESKVPVLAIAGDKDLICPPEAVYETAKLFPKDLVTYKVFGKSGGPHYAHYDLVGGRSAADQLYPCIIEFLIQHDKA